MSSKDRIANTHRPGEVRQIRYHENATAAGAAMTRALRLAICASAALLAWSAPPLLDAKARLLVLTDIGNEPDDQMSLVRLLCYSNEIDIEGLVATTSTWQKEKASPQIIRGVIETYAQVRPNLMKHAPGWPTAYELLRKVRAGQTAYGMAATGPDKTSPGAALILEAAQREDSRPLWIGVWGGANTLAQALIHARASMEKPALDGLISKLRVYSISDQDDAGPWIRREFPTLFYIVKPSSPNGEEYASATWTGISGDEYYRNGEGADFTTVSHEWIDRNIRAKGRLGAHYPKHLFIMEGDTPSFLGLIDNGLDADRSPSWGGWGGRYVLRQPYGETRAIWTQGGDAFSRVTSADSVKGSDGRTHVSDQATIWRWREAFQNDFAARMDWSVKDRAAANHPPVVTVNGVAGTDPIRLDIKVGESVTLDSAGTRDPDNNRLTFNWFHYAEAGASEALPLGSVEIQGATEPHATLQAVATCRPNWLGTGRCGEMGIAHVILAVTDSGTPALTRYRRIVLTIHNGAKKP
jgi:hypothetical protein